MTFEEIQPYVIPAAAAVYLIYRFLKFRRVKAGLPGLAAGGAVFVDVRTPAEHAAGSRPGSLNIPLDELERRAGELDKSRTIVLCCASGARSGVAASILKRKGFTVVNAGPWQNTLDR